MPLLLILGGTGLLLSGGYMASAAGEAARKGGNAGVKLAAASSIGVGLYLYLKRRK